MRKRIALFANGWGSEYLEQIGNGVERFCTENDVDVFAFVNHTAYAELKEENQGEFNIYTLPDLHDFDGAVLLSNSFNLPFEIEYLQEKIMEAGIPAVSLEQEIPCAHFLGADNYSGMHELAEHIVHEHHAKRMVFIGGFQEHPECQERLRAFLDVAEENRILVSESDVMFGDWSAASAENCMNAWLEKNGSLPDAILCANDIMAMGVCDWVETQGYRVPEDVIVTGFDCIQQGQDFRIPLTSVDRSWEDMGYMAARMLFADQKQERKSIFSETKMSLGKSCGCKDAKGRYESGKIVRINGATELDGFSADRHFRHMYMAVRKNETAQDLNYSLSYFFQHEGFMEGDNFMLCLNQDFFVLDEYDDILRQEGYAEEMDIVCCLRNGETTPLKRMKTKEAIFSAAESSDKPGAYIFLPLHSENRHLGFAMLARDFTIARINMLYIWTRHMNQYLEQVRSNAKIAELTRKLSELSVTDVLTATYNRAGCNKIIYPFLEETVGNGVQCIFMIADVDHMKTINDEYGHTSGDLALQTVSYILKNELPEGFMVARYGGDEFLIAGKSDGIITIERIIANLTRRLAEEVKNRQIKFELTMSIGGVYIKPGDKYDLNESLQKADENMYKMKEKHHGDSIE